MNTIREQVGCHAMLGRKAARSEVKSTIQTGHLGFTLAKTGPHVR
jgi:hypothetical protein